MMMRACRFCRKPFEVVKKPGSAKRYCSPLCRQYAHYRRFLENADELHRIAELRSSSAYQLALRPPYLSIEAPYSV